MGAYIQVDFVLTRDLHTQKSSAFVAQLDILTIYIHKTPEKNKK